MLTAFVQRQTKEGVNELKIALLNKYRKETTFDFYDKEDNKIILNKDLDKISFRSPSGGLTLDQDYFLILFKPGTRIATELKLNFVKTGKDEDETLHPTLTSKATEINLPDVVAEDDTI